MKDTIYVDITNEITNKLKKYEHIIIKFKNANIKEEIVDCLVAAALQEDLEDILLLDLSKKGENNRKNDEQHNGTIKKLDIDNAHIIIANGIGIDKIEDCISRFVITTGHKKSILLTNYTDDIQIFFKDNPMLETILPCIELYINENNKLETIVEINNI